MSSRLVSVVLPETGVLKLFIRNVFKKNHVQKDVMLFPCGMSRSGTTLLATVLDSHSQISMAYELIPPPLQAPVILLETLSGNSKDKFGSLEEVCVQLKRDGLKDESLFFKRCYRAGLSMESTVKALEDLAATDIAQIKSLQERLTVAFTLAREKQSQERTSVFGFKLNIPSISQAHKFFPGGHYIYILRDPRDVVASHRKRGFARTTKEICAAWNNYLSSFLAFNKEFPSISTLIRYEDLVAKPRETIVGMFKILPLEVEEAVFDFYKSEATVHKTGHPNAEALSQNFFTTSVDRWREELDFDSIGEVEKICCEGMLLGDYR